jgi:opacity protein-like surface antigen
MLKKTLLMVAAASLMAAPAMAQEKKAEISVLVGYSFADGVDTSSNIPAGDGHVYNRVDPKDGFKWGLGGGALVGPNVEVGFLFGQLMSKLQFSGTNTVDAGDMKVNNYHGYLGYNWGDPGTVARPYFFGGLGATQFGSVNYTRSNGQTGTGTINSSTKFSTTWGLGVKVAPPNGHVGARFGVQWTPTYIKSEATGGYWCDPYWGCYLSGVAKFANQWDLTAGLTFGF